ncbi:MAG: hypothetical protein AB2693_03835 [Candidatus Thiodiazotropha sp.]
MKPPIAMITLYHKAILIWLATRAINFITGNGWVFDHRVLSPMADPKRKCPISAELDQVMVQNHKSIPEFNPVEIS